MGFPTPPLVGVHPRECSTGDQIFPGILPSEEVRKNNIIEIIQGKRLMTSPPESLVDLSVIPVISE